VVRIVREEWGQLHHPPVLILRQAQLKALLKYASYDIGSISWRLSAVSYLISCLQMHYHVIIERRGEILQISALIL
jgi:hypothetical protein